MNWLRRIFKPERVMPPAMSLDMRGRLVADPRVVFNLPWVHAEIEAARRLGRMLKK